MKEERKGVRNQGKEKRGVEGSDEAIDDGIA